MNIHFLPADSCIETFRNSEIGGEVAICRECLIEGDVNADDLASFWLIREKFLAETVDQSGRTGYVANVVNEFEKLCDRDVKEIYLWFEYELFCSVNMWFCLSLLNNSSATIYRVAPIVVNERDIWNGFGNLNSEDYRACFSKRIKFSNAEILLGANLWKAFQNKDLERLYELGQTKSKGFPKLKEVCNAEIEKETRPKNTLKKIIETGETDFGKIFTKFKETEGVYGFGDSQVKRILREI